MNMEDYDRLKQERDELAAQVEVMREALRGCSGWVEAYGEVEAKDIVRAAISITPSDAIREIQARTLEEVAYNIDDANNGQLSSIVELQDWTNQLRELAAAIRKGEST